MPEHDLSSLYAVFPDIIRQISDTFTSHTFILELARQHQILHIEALYDYRHATHRGGAAPFMMVHRFIAQHLSEVTDLVAHEGQVSSTDIFGQSNECAV